MPFFHIFQPLPSQWRPALIQLPVGPDPFEHERRPLVYISQQGHGSLLVPHLKAIIGSTRIARLAGI